MDSLSNARLPQDFENPILPGRWARIGSGLVTIGLLLAIVSIGAFLFLRVWETDRWSGWSFGDAQTMVAVQNWRHEGFLATKFLWIPQGYSKVAKLFDTEILNQHARGIKLGDDGVHYKALRRIYTHYPSWYAVPYGIFAKMGVYDKSVYQSFALVLSFAGVFFWFLLCRALFGVNFALLSAALYLFTPTFFYYSGFAKQHSL